MGQLHGVSWSHEIVCLLKWQVKYLVAEQNLHHINEINLVIRGNHKLMANKKRVCSVDFWYIVKHYKSYRTSFSRSYFSPQVLWPPNPNIQLRFIVLVTCRRRLLDFHTLDCSQRIRHRLCGLQIVVDRL
jgi:hypothetical protein